MKKFLLVFILIIIGFAKVNAQNYQTYFSDRTLSFKNAYAGLKFQQVDSIEVNQEDSVFWFFPNFDMVDYDCIKANGPNWSGRKVSIMKNGDNVFFNRQNDSILIKTHAALNTPWLAYNHPDTYQIFAEVINHDTLTFLGVTDSVKTIGFQVYDVNNDSVPHVLNSKYLKISKRYGILSTFLFRDFPDYQTSDANLITYDIAGMSDPGLGVQNLTWIDVFGDFYPGDEIHVVGNECYGWLDDLICKKRQSIFRYLDWVEYQDSIKYTIERISGYKQTENGSFVAYEHIHDTITSLVSFNANMIFNRISEEPIFQQDNISCNLQSIQSIGDGKNVMIKTMGLYDDLEMVSEECWTFPMSDVLTLTYDYMQGLGGPYYWASMWDSFAERKLVYYKKGEEEWGTPLTIMNETGIVLVGERSIAVFPNPSKDFIVLKTDVDLPYVFEIVDMKGLVLISESIGSKDHQINTSYLKPGVYIYQIRDEDLVYKTGKLIIKE